MTKEFGFSYSRWSDWHKCPASYNYKHNLKIPEPYSAALEKGRKVHDEIAKFLIGAKGAEMPDSLSKHFSTLGQQLRDALDPVPMAKKLVERKMAFDTSFRQTSWNGHTTAWRFTWDAAVEPSPQIIHAVDWKTGKPYGSYDDQKQLFCLPAFWRNPQLEEFHGYWVYLDHGIVHEEVFGREYAAELHKVWVQNRELMKADRVYPATPSQDACKFCKFSWREGGPCKEGV